MTFRRRLLARSSGADGSESRPSKHEKISWRKWQDPDEERQGSSRREEGLPYARRDRSWERSRTLLPAQPDRREVFKVMRHRSRSRSGRPGSRDRDRDRDRPGSGKGIGCAEGRGRTAAAGSRLLERAPPLGPAGPPEYDETSAELRARK